MAGGNTTCHSYAVGLPANQAGYWTFSSPSWLTTSNTPLPRYFSVMAPAGPPLIEPVSPGVVVDVEV